MNAQLNPSTERVLRISIDLGERLFVLMLFATFVVRLSHTIISRPYNLLVLLSEGLVVLLVLIRRTTANVSMRPLDWVVALAGTALPLLLRAGGSPPLPTAIGTVLMFGGLSFAIWAKACLRRSFGLAAANRGAVEGGPYRWVRHPMYAGYIFVYIGFSLNNPLTRNLAIFAAIVALLVLRILAEERVLRTDSDYGRYRSIVGYRLIPGLF